MDEQKKVPETETGGEGLSPDPARKKLFGRGIYGSKDVPIRILDGLIAGIIIPAIRPSRTRMGTSLLP